MPVLHIIWKKELVIAANYIGNSTFMIYNSSFIESFSQPTCSKHWIIQEQNNDFLIKWTVK